MSKHSVYTERHRGVDTSEPADVRAPKIIYGHGSSIEAYSCVHREGLLEDLAIAGSVLLREFASLSLTSFRKGLTALVEEFLEAQGEHTPADSRDRIYNPVTYSPERKLLWHNENSFNACWPEMIAFGVLRAAENGGESLLVNSRLMLSQLDPLVVEEFRAKGVQYVRRMGLGIDRHWRDILASASKAEAEAHCSKEGVAFRWLDADVLETRVTRRATVSHPVTGEECWFNQVPHWHRQCLEPEVRRDLLSLLGEEMMPRDCRFGDGSVIPNVTVNHILETYHSLEVPIAYQEGDVLIVDNVATAHGRNPYEGKRELLVAMGHLRRPLSVSGCGK